MKYIDAEKLIERLEEMKQAEYENCGGVNAKTGALYEVQNLIESLQQERLDGYNRAMLEIKAKVDKLYDETSIGLNEYDSGFYNGIVETCMKLRGFIKARLDSDKQLEVDLEKEVDATMKRYLYHITCREEQISFARHFYEIGRARKEE